MRAQNVPLDIRISTVSRNNDQVHASKVEYYTSGNTSLNDLQRSSQGTLQSKINQASNGKHNISFGGQQGLTFGGKGASGDKTRALSIEKKSKQKVSANKPDKDEYKSENRKNIIKKAE